MYRSRGSSITGSPFTTAKLISTCSGGATAAGAGAGSFEATSVNSGFMTGSSFGAQMHRPAHIFQGLACRFTCLLRALRDNIADELRVLLEFLAAPPHRRHLLDDLVDERLLAVKAADAGAAASLARPRARRLIRVDLVQIPNGTLVRIARIGAAHARRIGLHRAQLVRDLLRILAQTNGVAIGLRH